MQETSGTRKGIVVLSILLLFVLGILGLLRQKTDKGLGLASSAFLNTPTDVVGTHSGTSTVGVGFRITNSGGQSATSSYVAKIGQRVNTATYQVFVTNASSSSNLAMAVQGSNDDYCSTTNTDTAVDLPLVSDIHWYSAGDHKIGTVGAFNFTNASSTVVYTMTNPQPYVGQEIILTNLNYECLRFQISGSSTVAYVGLTTK